MEMSALTTTCGSTHPGLGQWFLQSDSEEANTPRGGDTAAGLNYVWSEWDRNHRAKAKLRGGSEQAVSLHRETKGNEWDVLV